jgi:hypothetical protein
LARTIASQSNHSKYNQHGPNVTTSNKANIHNPDSVRHLRKQYPYRLSDSSMNPVNQPAPHPLGSNNPNATHPRPRASQSPLR